MKISTHCEAGFWQPPTIHKTRQNLGPLSYMNTTPWSTQRGFKGINRLHFLPRDWPSKYPTSSSALFPKIGVWNPQNGWLIFRENPFFGIDDLGGSHPIFLETPWLVFPALRSRTSMDLEGYHRPGQLWIQAPMATPKSTSNSWPTLQLIVDSMKATLPHIIMEVENHPKWNEINIGGTHFPLPWLCQKGCVFRSQAAKHIVIRF